MGRLYRLSKRFGPRTTCFSDIRGTVHGRCPFSFFLLLSHLKFVTNVNARVLKSDCLGCHLYPSAIKSHRMVFPMSNFACEKCGVHQIDGPTGYVEGCSHYPPLKHLWCLVSFDGVTFDTKAYYSTAWYTSGEAEHEGRAIHPICWKAKPAEPN